jgi:hypothetical protein
MQVPGVERGGTGAKKGGKGRERRDAPRHRHAWAQERGKGWERRDTQAQEEGKGVRDMWAREGGVPLPTREGWSGFAGKSQGQPEAAPTREGQAEKGPGRPPKGEPIGRRHLPPQTVHQAWHAYLIAHRSPPAWVLIGARRDTRVQEEGKGARDMGAGGVPLQLNKGTLIILASLS